MEALFLKLLNMSITASWLILAVIVLRFLLQKAPKSIRCFLWALVGIRLVCPFSWESVLSLIPSAETVSPDILYSEAPTIHSGISVLNQTVNPVISESLAPNAGASVNPMQAITYAASIVWIIGMAALVLYSVISYVRLRRRVTDAVILRDNLWQSEKVTSPFVLGLLRPRIYLPFGVDEESLTYVVAHENAHIRRRDHWIKPGGFLLLTVYWFNPLIWLSYILLCRDVELACDERVVKEMGSEDKKAYSEALLLCSIPHRMIAACPLAFGEVGVKERIKNVLDYKKPAFWIIVVAFVSCVAVAVCFLTNPKDDGLYAPEPFGHSYSVEAVVYDDPVYSFTYTPDTAPQYCLAADYALMEKEAGESGWISLGGLQEEHLSPLVFDDYFREADGAAGWLAAPYGPERLRLDNQAAWSLITEDTLYYVLLQNNGDVYLAYGYNNADVEYPGSKGSIRWLFKLSVADAEASSENYTFVEATAYISQSCLYMNPLSSTFADGDSGCRYLIGEDSATIMRKQTGDIIAISSPVGWDWQEVSGEEWDALFPLEIGAPDISGYSKSLIVKLSSQYYLFNMDGELWFGDRHGGKVGMWSVYSLVPESSAGATWEYAPVLSSRVPAFPFRFNLEYTRIEAECTGGYLIGFDDYDGTGYPQGKALTVPAGSALYWSPTAADAGPALALTARISFTVYNGDEAGVYTGAVSISGTTGTGSAAAIYNAVLSEGDDLMLIRAPDTDGALIQAAGKYATSSVGGIGWPQHLAVAQADLDGDGANESVTVTKKDDGLYVLSVLKANGFELWSEEMSTARTGWDSLFLCTLDGKDYLLRYNPTMSHGECSYRYTLLTLQNGRENLKQTRTVEFDVNGTNLLDVNEMTSFADEVNALLEKSILLLRTEGGITAIGPFGAEEYLENYAVLFASGASNLTEAAIIRAAQVYVRDGRDFGTITNFDAPGIAKIDSSRFAGMLSFTTGYDADGPFYEVTFETADDAILGPISLFVDSHGTVFGSPGRD